MSALFSLSLTIVSAGEKLGNNIVVNSGFESSKGDFVMGWEKYNDGVRISTDNLGEDNGTQVLMLKSSGKFCGFQQSIYGVKTDAIYKLEVSILADGFTQGKIIPLYVTILKKGAPQACLELRTVSPASHKKGEWEKYSATLDMNKYIGATGHVVVWGLISGDFKGSVYFDNYTMKEILSAKTQNDKTGPAEKAE